MVGHQRAREAAVHRGPLLVALEVARRRLEHGDARARAPLDRGRKADVVEMVMRTQDELDVVQANALQSEAALERLELR